MIDSSLVVDLRTGIKHISANEWMRIAQDLQYQSFAKVLQSNTLNQMYLQLLEGQVIRDYGEDGGGVRFDEQVLAKHTYTNHTHKWGWSESLNKFEDLDANGIVGGEGINLLNQATTNATAAAAYYPQKLAIAALRAGETTVLETDGKNKFKLVCYDSQPLFSLTHPYNFKRTALGNFANLFVNTATTTPKFLPLAGPFAKNAGTGVWEYNAAASVSVEDGYHNLWETITYIVGNIKMPDGKTPRKLKPSKVICGPKLRENVTTMLKAKFISTKSGSSGGGSTEIEAVIRTLGLAEPTFLDELGGLGTNEEYDWYIICEENQSASELGAINIGMRKGWKISLFTGQGGTGPNGEGAIQMELAISDDMVAIGSMRMFVGVGLPQFIFKNKAPRS